MNFKHLFKWTGTSKLKDEKYLKKLLFLIVTNQGTFVKEDNQNK